MLNKEIVDSILFLKNSKGGMWEVAISLTTESPPGLCPRPQAALTIAM